MAQAGVGGTTSVPPVPPQPCDTSSTNAFEQDDVSPNSQTKTGFSKLIKSQQYPMKFDNYMMPKINGGRKCHITGDTLILRSL